MAWKVPVQRLSTIIVKEVPELKRQIARFASAALLLSMIALSSWAADDPAVLKSISYQKIEKGLEVTILLEGPFIFQSFTLTNPPRLAIDFSPVDRIEADLYYEIGTMGVTSLRTGEFAPQIVRVVFDFSDQIMPGVIKKIEGGIVVRLSTEEPQPAVPVKEEPKVAPRIKPKAAEAAAEIAPKENFYNTMIGLNVGSYKIPDARFAEVYKDEATPIYGLTLSRTLVSLGNFQFDISAEARLYKKTGAATVSQEEAKFTMMPIISIAPRLLFQTKFALFFAGGGVDFYSYKEESTLATTTGSASGWHYQAGLYFIPPSVEFLRIKLYYKFTKLQALQNDIQVELGGNEYGVGLCFGFNFLNGALVNR
jgi:AMIN domain